MTDDRGQNYAQAFPKAEIVTIKSATFADRGLVGKAFAVARLAFGALVGLSGAGAFEALRSSSGFGGYPALPTMFAAARRGLPSIVHEQNAVLGRVNRWLSPAVTRIASAFPRLANLDSGLGQARGGHRQSGSRRGARRATALCGAHGGGAV